MIYHTKEYYVHKHLSYHSCLLRYEFAVVVFAKEDKEKRCRHCSVEHFLLCNTNSLDFSRLVDVVAKLRFKHQALFAYNFLFLLAILLQFLLLAQCRYDTVFCTV